MSRYIDADNLHNVKFQNTDGYGENVAYRVGWNEAIEAIEENEPTAIDIVRCKECKWAEPNREGDYDCRCHIPIFRVIADDYCSMGERRDP